MKDSTHIGVARNLLDDLLYVVLHSGLSVDRFVVDGFVGRGKAGLSHGGEIESGRTPQRAHDELHNERDQREEQRESHVTHGPGIMSHNHILPS